MSKNLVHHDWLYDEVDDESKDVEETVKKFRDEKSPDSKRYKKKDFRLNRKRKIQQKGSWIDA